MLVTEILPMALPAVVGVNLAVNVLFAPAAIEIGSVNPDTEYPVPDALSAEIVTVKLPVLFNVIVWELLLPTDTVP